MKTQEIKEALNYLKNNKERSGASIYTFTKDLSIEALEKQVPKKPVLEGSFIKYYECPVCNCEALVGRKQNFCHGCGTRFDWGEGDFND